MERAIVSDLASGALLQRGSFLVPAVDGKTSFSAKADIGQWHEAGFDFCIAKQHSLAEADRRTLARLFGWLRSSGAGGVPPYWITENHVVTLFLPDASDLRPIETSQPVRDAQAVHGLCIASLTRFLSIQGDLLEAMDGAAPRSFPILERYLASLGTVETHLGAGACSGLPEVISGACSGSSTSLFFDPKPANMIMRMQDRTNLWCKPEAPVYRIDLDMLCWQSPLALQLVLIYFAFPVAFEIEGDLSEQFEHQLHCLIRACRVLDAGPEDQVHDLVWYHLMRNFAGALERRQGPKVRQMALLLQCAASRVGTADAINFGQRLAEWLEAAGGRRGADN